MYVIRFPQGYYGRDSVTGNITLQGERAEAKEYDSAHRASMDARFMVGAEVVPA